MLERNGLVILVANCLFINSIKGKKICAQDFDEIEIAKLKSKGSEKEKIANCVNGLVNLHANGQTIIEDDDDDDDNNDDKDGNDDDDEDDDDDVFTLSSL